MSEHYDGLQRRLEGGVLTITFDRPAQLNALWWSMVEGLTAWVDEAGKDPAVRVVVITGEGRAFCSGDDIVGGMGGPRGSDNTADRGRLVDTTTRGPHHEMVQTLLSTPKPPSIGLLTSDPTVSTASSRAVVAGASGGNSRPLRSAESSSRPR